MALCDDLHALAYLHGSLWSADELARQVMPTKEGKDIERGTYFEPRFPTWFALVRECRTLSSNALKSFVDDGAVRLPTIEIGHVVVRSPGLQSLAESSDTTDYVAELKAMVRGELVRRDPLKEIRSLFIDRLRTILVAGREALSRCEAPTCRRIYVKVKRRQRYCSNTCRSRINVRRKRQRDRKKKTLQRRARHEQQSRPR